MKSSRLARNECRHGLEADWCATCNDTDYQTPNPAPVREQCCAPRCTKRAAGVMADLPLCDDHKTKIVNWREREWPRERYYAGLEAEDEYWRTHESWVYFVQMGDAVKIGYTMSLKKRFEALTSFTTGTLLALEAGDRSLEQKLHRRFRKHRLPRLNGGSTELFEMADPILDYIDNGRTCGECRRKATSDSPFCPDHADTETINALPFGYTAGVSLGPQAR